ncbi:MAG: galactokinase, partial [Clostridia bacterium]|nr:galactokinase [Clostridia bacterium]
LKKLDFADKNHIKVDNIEGNLDDYTLILINTGGSHANLTDEYAAIPAEMKAVAKAFQKERLIDLSENELYNADKLKGLPDRAVMRAIHFFEENKRVDRAEKALNNGDYSEFLTCVKESGVSSLCKLQNCYVAGAVEQPIPKALSVSERFLNGGANRVHGGGFAGTILNIVKNADTEQFIDNTSKFFGKENVIKLKVRKIGTIVL